MRRLALVLGLAVVLIACGSAKPSTTSGTGGGGSIEGRVVAGPTCPVAGPPGCEDRPVPGAVIVVRNVSGDEVARATTGADGLYRVEVAPGHYTVEPQPVEGMMGTAGPSEVDVPGPGGVPATVDFGYDTGIRN